MKGQTAAGTSTFAVLDVLWPRPRASPNLAPISWPRRQTTVQSRGRALRPSAENHSTNRSGTSVASTKSRTPPSERSVTRQSRGGEPIAISILAGMLTARRWDLRLSILMAVLDIPPTPGDGCAAAAAEVV
jgi:hypothetical protein